MATPPLHVPPAPTTAPAARRELSARAVVISVLVAVIMGASFPPVVLKIGYGPNISVSAAFFGFIALAITAFFTRVPATVYEANMAQTAGTAAGEIGFMCIVLAAIDMLNDRPGLGFSLHLSGLQIFLWLTFAGLTGAFLAVPLRRHYIDEENLTFADGTAAGETLVVLYQGAREAAVRLKALFGGMGLSAFIAFFRDGPWTFIPGELAFGRHGAALRMGTEVGVLSLGAGMLVGLRVTLSMALGMVVAWVIAPPVLVSNGWVARQAFPDVLRWVMWPATGLMVAGGLTALVLKWNVIARTFKKLSAKDVGSDEIPLRYVAWGAGLCAVALAVVQKISLGFPYWLTA
ncbi:MAG TPA: OPT/YSL family transporter, partial [Anaeromyxobacteraceae bacterium]